MTGIACASMPRNTGVTLSDSLGFPFGAISLIIFFVLRLARFHLLPF